MKSYTDLEQSKMLAEILPLESADMFWLVVGNTSRAHVLTEPLSNYSKWKNYPCWSLAALLSVLPNYHITNNGITGVVVWSMDIYSKEHPNPIDACVEMILKLKENNKL